MEQLFWRRQKIDEFEYLPLLRCRGATWTRRSAFWIFDYFFIFCPSPLKYHFVRLSRISWLVRVHRQSEKDEKKEGREEEREIQSASWPLNRSSAGQKLAVLGLYRSTDRSILFVMVGHYFGFLLLLWPFLLQAKTFVYFKIKNISLRLRFKRQPAGYCSHFGGN